MQWNVTYEKELTKSVSASAGYVANRGYNMLQILPGNLPVLADSDPEQHRGAAAVRITATSGSSTRVRELVRLAADHGRHSGRAGLTARFTYVYGAFYDIVAKIPLATATFRRRIH